MRKTGRQWLDQLRAPSERLAHRARLRIGSLEPGDAWMIDDRLAALETRDRARRFWALSGLSRERKRIAVAALEHPDEDVRGQLAVAVRSFLAR